jgi:hypothetical protein
MSKKLTPWFPEIVKPARIGVYNASICEDPRVWRYWDGANWSFNWRTGASKFDRKIAMTYRTNSNQIRWRGLAKEPK